MTKIISLSQAKEITELMKEKGFELPESEYYWFDDNFKNTKEGHDYFLGRINQHGDITLNDYPAYDCYELLEMMPTHINEKYQNLEISKSVYNPDNDFKDINYSVEYGNIFSTDGKDSIINALADTLIYLLKNNLYKND